MINNTVFSFNEDESIRGGKFKDGTENRTVSEDIERALSGIDGTFYISGYCVSNGHGCHITAECGDKIARFPLSTNYKRMFFVNENGGQRIWLSEKPIPEAKFKRFFADAYEATKREQAANDERQAKRNALLEMAKKLNSAAIKSEFGYEQRWEIDTRDECVKSAGYKVALSTKKAEYTYNIYVYGYGLKKIAEIREELDKQEIILKQIEEVVR